jgi:putative peptide zinc metalloprotease protein
MSDGRSAPSPLYRLNPAARITPFDVSGRGPMFQVVVRDRRFQVNESTLKLLRTLDRPMSVAELEHAIVSADVGVEAQSKRPALVIEALKQMDLLVDHNPAAADLDTAGTRSPSAPPKRHPLSIRLPLVSRRWTLPLTTRLQHLYTPAVAAVLVPAIVAAHVVMFMAGGASGHHALSSHDYVIALVVLVATLAFHELGHLSACERFGAVHGEIGIGLFVIWPIAYANVSDCWSLPRWQRATVDLGGIYFHSICSAVCCVLWLYSGNYICLVIVRSILAATLLNLNPFIKFDGYWLLTDITGIPSLHRAVREAATYATARVLRRTPPAKPEVLSASPFVVALFILYWTGTVAFVAYLFSIVARYLPRALEAIPTQLATLWHLASQLDFGWDFWKLAVATVVLCATSYTLLRMVILRCVRYARQAVRLLRPQETGTPSMPG